MADRHQRLATLTLAVLQGDLSAAPRWYREALNSAERRLGRETALRVTMADAAQLGLSPVQVEVDRATGEPLAWSPDVPKWES